MIDGFEQETASERLKTLFEKTGSYNVKVYYSSYLEISDDVPFGTYGASGVKQFTVTGISDTRFEPLSVGNLINNHGHVSYAYSGYEQNQHKWTMQIRIESVEFFMDEMEKVFKKLYDDQFYQEFENDSSAR